MERSEILEKERETTDKSLSEERKKTNTSVTNALEKAELRTDHFVEEERIDADARRETLTVNNERIQQARSQVGMAINIERELKNDILNNLLQKERGQTDQNLRVERNRADSELHNQTHLLSEEVTEHSKTKISLTTRDEFLAIVSHDLRNPIGAISSCADLLLEKSNYKSMDSDELRNWIELMKQSADVALRLISDILNMESIAEGKLQLKLEPHNIDKIIHESVASFFPAASAKHQLLRILPSNIIEDVLCDHDRILQVLSNLIGNSPKFTPKGGSISLSASSTDTDITVSVSDTGPGIPEDKKGLIFERVAQLGSNDRRGLGLGLYISKMLIEEHRGKLWVQSKLGEGSTFYFSIPKQNPNHKSLHP